MPLQLRLLGSIFGLLVLALLLGGGLLIWHAREEVRVEVTTAFQGAEHSVRDTLKSDVEHTVTLRQVVASFEGQRHVRAALVNEKGRVLVHSEIRHLTDPAPVWFARLMTPPPMASSFRINLKRFPCTVELHSDPASEIADVWARARDAFFIMLLFCVGTMGLVALFIAHALRFFTRLQTGLLAVSEGHYGERLPIQDPPEFAAVARGFNYMIERLASISERNRRLQLQIGNVQEEERAGIARDLHDEVGPYLFAIQVDAKKVSSLPFADARELGASIREAVLHAQQHVRDILRQLRPGTSVDFGLEAAIDDLIRFWSRRNPEIDFDLVIDTPVRSDRRRDEAAYRIVQESVSNAVRHGCAKRIAIRLTADETGLGIEIEDDGKGLQSDIHAAIALGHVGLVGMKERAAALKGEFRIEELNGKGLRIRVRLPNATQAAAA
jgi:two-component system sensor histidine kinase UhpB